MLPGKPQNLVSMVPNRCVHRQVCVVLRVEGSIPPQKSIRSVRRLYFPSCADSRNGFGACCRFNGAFLRQNVLAISEGAAATEAPWAQRRSAFRVRPDRENLRFSRKATRS